MSVISKMRRQKAILWLRTGVSEFNEPLFSAPVEVACRWDDLSEVFFSSDGKELVSKAIVYPDREVPTGSYFLKATQTEFDALDLTTALILKPQDIPGAYPVMSKAITPNFKNTENLYTNHL